jgi:uncharacterized ubiquitin-like protein YukD
MITQQLIDYINQQISLGVSREQINRTLQDNGWQQNDIQEAFTKIGISESSTPTTSYSFTPTQNPMTQSDDTTSPKNTIKKFLVLSVALLTVIGLGILGYFAYGYFSVTPEKILAKVMVNIENAKTVRHQGSITANMQITELPSFQELGFQPDFSNMQVFFTAESDMRNLESMAQKMILSISTGFLGIPGTLELETRSINDVLYAQLKNIPQIAMIAELVDVNTLQNTWIRIEDESAVDDPDQVLEQYGITPEKAEQIMQVFQNTRIIEITDRLPDEKRDGKDLYRFSMTVNTLAVETMLREMLVIIDDESLYQQFETGFNQVADVITGMDGEVWIDKTELLPYKANFVVTLGGDGVTGTFTTSIDSFEYNYPVDIQIPTASKSIEEFFKIIPNSEMGGVQSYPQVAL